jgi:hypothetical protein
MDSFNGTIEDEVIVLGLCLCLRSFGVRSNWFCASMTTKEPAGEGSWLRKFLPDLSEETLADFLAKNRKPHPVEPHFTLGGQLDCLSTEDLERIFLPDDTTAQAGWDRFYELYPQSEGIVSFSRVGFDANVTQALVYTAQSRDALYGRGTYWLCVKSGERWAVLQSNTAWVS